MTRKAANFDHEHCECVAGLEHDLKDLKRRLAEANGESKPANKGSKRRANGDDWLDDLPKPDADYFRRRLGVGR